MAGLMQRAQQAKAAKAQNVKAATGDPGSTEELTPEESAAFDKGLDAATKMLYENDKIGMKIAEMLQGDQPAQAIGDAAAMLTKQADDALGGKLPETVIIPLGVRLVGEIADMGEELKVIDTDPKMLRSAIQIAIKRLLEDYGVDDQGAAAAQSIAGKYKGPEFDGESAEIGAGQQAAPQAPPQQGSPPEQPAQQAAPQTGAPA